eukprot:CFRG8392T1
MSERNATADTIVALGVVPGRTPRKCKVKLGVPFELSAKDKTEDCCRMEWRKQERLARADLDRDINALAIFEEQEKQEISETTESKIATSTPSAYNATIHNLDVDKYPEKMTVCHSKPLCTFKESTAQSSQQLSHALKNIEQSEELSKKRATDVCANEPQTDATAKVTENSWGLNNVLNNISEMWSSPSDFVIESLRYGADNKGCKGEGNNRVDTNIKSSVRRIKHLDRDSPLLHTEEREMPWDDGDINLVSGGKKESEGNERVNENGGDGNNNMPGMDALINGLYLVSKFIMTSDSDTGDTGDENETYNKKGKRKELSGASNLKLDKTTERTRRAAQKMHTDNDISERAHPIIGDALNIGGTISSSRESAKLPVPVGLSPLHNEAGKTTGMSGWATRRAARMQVEASSKNHDEKLREDSCDSMAEWVNIVPKKTCIPRTSVTSKAEESSETQHLQHDEVQTFILENVHRGWGDKCPSPVTVSGSKRKHDSISTGDNVAKSEDEDNNEERGGGNDSVSVLEVVDALASILSPIDWFV